MTRTARSSLTLALALGPALLASGPAAAQRLLVVNCDDGELRSWPGWLQVDTVTAEELALMPLPNVLAYDVIESSHCVDEALRSEAVKTKLLSALLQGTSFYGTTFNGETSWLPGQVSASGADACADEVALPASALTHPIITGATPDLTGADLSNVGCALHGSFDAAGSQWEVIAVSSATGNPVMLAGTFSCGRAFLRSHHFHSTTEGRAVRFVDSVVDWLLGAGGTSGLDSDGDGVDNSCDNCPALANSAQLDCDADGAGDLCDPTGGDADADGVHDACDTCPNLYNPLQPRDGDGDGTDDACDNCPALYNRDQADCDSDAIGDRCDLDTDNDGAPDGCDNCEDVANPLQYDTDNDGVGDSCELVTQVFNWNYFDDVTITYAEPDVNTNFPSLQIHGTTAGPTKMGLIYFDTRDLPPGSEIEHASLDLFQTVKDEITVTFHFVLAPWRETVVSWNTFNYGYDPVPYATHEAHLVDQETHIQVDATELVRGWVSGGRPNYGLVMKTTEEGVVRFGATERAVDTRRPRLDVTLRAREPALTLLVADGPYGGAGLLYSVNGATGVVRELGLIGYDVTSMATSPDGVVYGTAVVGTGYGELIIIDPRTGRGTPVGPLADGRRSFTSMPDCTFRRETLYCWTELDDQAATVDTATGEVNLLGAGIWAFGTGLASDALGQLYLLPHGPGADLFTVGPSSGVVSPVVRLRGTRENVTAMTFAEGRLFAIEQDAGRSFLVTIDPASGAFATIGELPSNADAITTLGYHP